MFRFPAATLSCVECGSRTIEDVDTQMGFANFVTTRRVLGRTGRIELASAVGEFAQAVSDLASKFPLEALAELERRARKAWFTRASVDQASLLGTTDEYARLVNSVRRWVWLSRASVLYHACQWRHAGAELRRIIRAYERKARSHLTASDIYVVRLVKCVFLVTGYKKDWHIVPMWAERWALYAMQEFEQVSRLVKPVKTEVAFTSPYAKRFRPSDPPPLSPVRVEVGSVSLHTSSSHPTLPPRINSAVIRRLFPLPYTHLFSPTKGATRLLSFLQESYASSTDQGPAPLDNLPDPRVPPELD
ncbi:hypothetical protein EDB83DRAFT_193102 [Lactarius deliciosus]|nr:hypothetical protein EDB83DRAFT_193102 [Lactarius deliciosus]